MLEMTQPTLRQAPKKVAPVARKLFTNLHHFLTTPSINGRDVRTVFWCALSLAFSVYFAGQALHQAFKGPYVVQDDARQHVFWMERFLDSQLFPNDLIADYFQSVAPSGYSALYEVIAHFGVDPLLLNKLLPMALALITTAYGFGVCLQILPVPGAAFFGTLILNQSLWMQDDLVSATPRAFFYPLFLAFLYYLLRDSRVACLAVIALQGLFYPSTVFISGGVLFLRLVSLENHRPRLSTVRRDYWFCAIGLGVALCVLLFYAFKMRAVGPVITASEARLLPEFLPGGRTHFFGYEGWQFWLLRPRSGLLPGTLVTDVPLYAALLLPFLLHYRRAFPLVEKITESINVLPRTILASLVMFVAAHLTLFKLHHPSRYTEHTLRIVFAIAAGITIAIIVDALFAWAERAESAGPARRTFAWMLATAVIALVVIYPRFVPSFPDTKYRTGHVPALYEFLSSRPKDAMVASLAPEVKNVPTFTRRSILLAREYALPYHKSYYAQMQERATDMISAQYSADLRTLQDFIRKYRVTLLLVDRDAFQPDYIKRDSWIMQYQGASREAVANLIEGKVPALLKLVDSCSVFHSDDLIVVDAECILSAQE
ncbi:MAG TPA: hypothetical protein VNS63_21615 [Blastocatellia bacterium]|nr:hypothetical protein [Blastocatellia bacterium]